MKRYLILISAILISINLYANDTFIFHGYSGTVLTPEDQKSIKLISETIRISLNERSYTVDVTFNFRNDGEEKTVLVGFPKYSSVQSASSEVTTDFQNFKTYVNGQQVKAELRELDGFGKLSEFYVKNVLFYRNEITTTRIYYESKYAEMSMGLLAVPYLYGTGMTWNDSWEMNIEIINEHDKWISDVFIQEEISTVSNDDGIIKITILKPQPDEYTEDFEVRLFHEPENIIYDYFWTESDDILSDLYLELLTPQQLRLLRNTFFAKHGYTFKSEELSSFFKDTDWYSPNSDFDESMLSSIEKENVQRILNEESSR